MLNLFFWKQTSAVGDLWQSFTDMHTHLLPGVDDGSSSLEESVEILSFLHKAGVKRVYLTPHVMVDYPKNRMAYLKEQFDCFLQGCQGTEVPELRLAAEYMLDEQFATHLEEGLLSYDGRHVLVEMSCAQPPNGLHEILYELQLKNYIPILAHPERYLFFSPEGFARLKEYGCQFQLNLFSLSGFYGAEVARQAKLLLQNGLYDYAGSDIHNTDYLELYPSFASLSMKKNNLLTTLILEKNRCF